MNSNTFNPIMGVKENMEAFLNHFLLKAVY